MGERADSVSDAEETDSRSGLVVAGTYRILSLLAAGSMGDVYEAENVRLGNRVAVKFPRGKVSADARATKRFRREASTLAALRSDHVVAVLDCGELEDGTPYLVMERLTGEDLRSLLQRSGALPVRRAVRIALDACHGLSVVHAAGLVHRDLKPANLFVCRSTTGAERCKILDFGVAKILASDATRPGVVLGTVRYMPPEQLENSASVSPAADSYALGAILYESLTGRPAHCGETIEELMFDILQRDPQPPSALRPVPRELDDIVLRALSRVPSKRFESVGQLASALEAFNRHTGATNASASSVETLSDASLVDVPLPSTAKRASTRSASLVLGAFAAGFGAAWLVRSTEGPASDETARPPDRPSVAIARENPASPRPSASSAPAPQENVVPVVALSAPAADAGKARAPSPAPDQRSLRLPSKAASDRFDRMNPYADP